MTVSTSRTYNPSITRVLRRAFRRCGLLNEHQDLTEAQAAVGREELDGLVDFLQVEGLAARTQAFQVITLAANTRDYQVEDDALDVWGDGAFIAAGQSTDKASGETPVQPMTIQEWQGLSSKDATGRPFRYYCDRTNDILVVKLWPIPSTAEAGASIRFVLHRLRADNLNGSKTLDFERFWNEYMVWALAHRLAFVYSLSSNLRMELRADAMSSLAKCRGAAAPTNPTDFLLGHTTQWSIRR